MHRKPEVELLPLDIELEKTLRNLKKVRSAESEVMEEYREIHQNTQIEATTERPQRKGTMKDFWRPIIRDEYSVVRQLAIDAKNFELKPTLITIV